MRSEDIGELKKLEDWKDFDKTKFLEDDEMAEKLLDQPYDISIRLGKLLCYKDGSFFFS
jgi:hypothetical protein